MTRADIIAVIFAFTLLPVLYIKLWQPGTQATQASITDSHHHVTVTNLDQTRRIAIEGELGNSTLQVEDGKIRFSQSPCKGKVCIHRGWMKYSGETMACLPNRVVVTLTGGVKKFDSINF